MAKVPTYPNLPTPADTDVIHIVDVSDTTDDATGSSKHIEVGDLLSGKADAAHTHTAAAIDAEASADGYVLTSDGAGNAAWEAASGGTGGKVLIEEITLSTAGEFDFNNIPQQYNRLIIKGAVRSSASAAFDGAFAILNADTTSANYHRQHFAYGNGALFSGGEAADPSVAFVAGGNATASAHGTVQLVIEDYAGSGLKTVAGDYNSDYGTDAVVVGKATSVSSITAAITRVRIRTDNDPADGLTGTLRLYGEM